jgi:hypothetical protein
VDSLHARRAYSKLGKCRLKAARWQLPLPEQGRQETALRRTLSAHKVRRTLERLTLSFFRWRPGKGLAETNRVVSLSSVAA